eukprot:12937476-Prorocentrum_lima.AAC.1
MKGQAGDGGLHLHESMEGKRQPLQVCHKVEPLQEFALLGCRQEEKGCHKVDPLQEQGDTLDVEGP